MKSLEKMFYSPKVYDRITLSVKEYIFVTIFLLLIGALILIQSLWCGMSGLIIMLLSWTLPLHIKAAQLRLCDQNLSCLWFALFLTGVAGIIYFSYLMFKPGADITNTITLIDENGNESCFEVLDHFVFDSDRYIILCENAGEEIPSAIVLRVKTTDMDFASVDDYLAEKVFEEFKRNHPEYEFV